MIAKFSLTPKARENPRAGRWRPRRARPESQRVSAFPAPVTETGLSVILYLDEMLAGCSKEHLVECARLLALDVAHYKQKYGELPVEKHLALHSATDIDDDTAKLLASAILEMAVTLALVTGHI